MKGSCVKRGARALSWPNIMKEVKTVNAFE